MNSNNTTTFIIAASMTIVAIFTTVIVLNLSPNYESNSYFTKVEETMTAKIEKLDIQDNNLIILTSDNPKEFCVKQTRTTPKSNSLCWNKIHSNTATIPILKNKKYYVWIKDKQRNISNYTSINESDIK